MKMMSWDELGKIASIDTTRVSYMHLAGPVAIIDFPSDCCGGNNWASMVRLSRNGQPVQNPSPHNANKYGPERIHASRIPDLLKTKIDDKYWTEFVTEAKEAAYVPAPCRHFGCLWLCCCLEACMWFGQIHNAAAKKKLQEFVQKHRGPMLERGIGIQYYDISDCYCNGCRGPTYFPLFGFFLTVEGGVEQPSATGASGAPVAQKMEQE